MTKRIRCSDVGPDCDFEAIADTEEELFELVADHASRVHGIDEPDPEMRQRVLAAMEDV